MSNPITASDDGVRIAARVTPRASKTAFDGVMVDDAGRAWIKLKVTAAPQKGKANKAAQKLLGKLLGVAPGRLVLLSGAADRNKTFFVADCAASERRLMEKLFTGVRGQNGDG